MEFAFVDLQHDRLEAVVHQGVSNSNLGALDERLGDVWGARDAKRSPAPGFWIDIHLRLSMHLGQVTLAGSCVVWRLPPRTLYDVRHRAAQL